MVVAPTAPTAPPAPPAPGGGAPRPGSRRRQVIAVLLALIVIVDLIEVLANQHRTTSGSAQTFAHPPYVPQLSRNAEWAGPPNGLSDREIDEIVQNAGIEVLPKFTDNYNIQAHFNDARRIAAAAKAVHNPIKIYDYFNASFWLTANEKGWGSYASGFTDAWLLHDANGQPIPFFGVGHQADGGTPAVGYMVDLTNPDYRAWAVRTIVAWMHEAPYSGIAFDSANPLLAGTARGSLGNGAKTNFEQLLCGGAGTVSCAKMDDWNKGLTALISDTTSALHALGDQVIYNGIAPAALRGPTRNLGLLHSADTASNEAFCLNPSTGKPGRVQYSSVTDDAAIMKSVAEQHKKVIEITNYQTPAKRPLGDYCFAGFMMGWQPGSSYFIFHPSYAATLTGGYPVVPEQNLALGSPTSSDYTASGGLLSRQFQNGFVAVNTGTKSAQVRIPVTGVQFSDGTPHGALVQGQTVELGAHQSLFLLTSKYLNG